MRDGWLKGGRGTPEREGGENARSGGGAAVRRGGGGGGGVRLRKEAASEQRGNKGLVSPVRCGYYIVPGAAAR